MLGIQVSGLDQGQAMIRLIPKETEKALAGKRLKKAGHILQRFWKLTLSGPRSGTRLGIVSGALRASLQVVRVNRLTVAIGTHLAYAPPHEFGSPAQGLPKRPHRKPALRLADLPMKLILGGAAKEGAELAKRKAKRISTTQRGMVKRA